MRETLIFLLGIVIGWCVHIIHRYLQYLEWKKGRDSFRFSKNMKWTNNFIPPIYHPEAKEIEEEKQ